MRDDLLGAEDAGCDHGGAVARKELGLKSSAPPVFVTEPYGERAWRHDPNNTLLMRLQFRG